LNEPLLSFPPSEYFFFFRLIYIPAIQLGSYKILFLTVTRRAALAPCLALDVFATILFSFPMPVNVISMLSFSATQSISDWFDSTVRAPLPLGSFTCHDIARSSSSPHPVRSDPSTYADSERSLRIPPRPVYIDAAVRICGLTATGIRASEARWFFDLQRVLLRLDSRVFSP